MRVTVKEIGKIRIDGNITISDPCYEPGIWCAFQERALPGWYKCFVEVQDIPVWGERIASMTAVREDFVDDYKLLPFYDVDRVGVDSGQMGIYDSDYFAENQVDNDYDNPESWYRQVCDVTLSDTQAGIMDQQGFVSASGYGDGSYNVIAFESNGDIVAIKVEFIYTDEEE